MTAGAAALLLARNSSLTPSQLKAALRATVDPVPGLDVSTGGRLNLNTAIRSVPEPAPPTPPFQPPPAPEARDARAPRVTGLVVSPSAFLPLRAGATISRTPRGARLRFRVDESSIVRVRVLARKAGRRSGRRCVKPTRANRRARACYPVRGRRDHHGEGPGDGPGEPALLRPCPAARAAARRLPARRSPPSTPP